MAHLNTIGVDLAKNVIQVSILTPRGKELKNKAFTRTKFKEFLVKQKSALVAFEACSSAHFWARTARELGHDIRILSPIAVAPFRQGHKTDENDARAVAEAAGRPNLKDAPLKSVEQQGYQAIQRSRELLVQDRTALSNHIRGLLLEFGITIPKGFASLRARLPEILEDAENGIPHFYRPALELMYRRFLEITEDVAELTRQIERLVNANESCKRLLKIEGVGPISAVLLFATLGTGEAFQSGREFSAYLGLTPKQYSSGGKTNLIGISRYIANKRLRSVLIQGARAYMRHLKEPKTLKDKWLLALMSRAGYGKASVALANKNVRTAWAMLTRGTEYQRVQVAAA